MRFVGYSEELLMHIKLEKLTTNLQAPLYIKAHFLFGYLAPFHIMI